MKLNDDGSVDMSGEDNDTDIDATAGVSSSDDDALDFEGLVNLDADLVDDLPPDPTTEQEPVVTPPVKAGESQQHDETPAVVTTEEPVVTPPTEETPAPTETPEQFAARLSEDRTKAIDEIAAGWEKSLSDADREALITEPARVIPKLLARAQIQAFESAVSTVIGQLPVLLERYNQNVRAASDAETAFYSTYGEDLRPHERDLQQAIAVIRAQAPTLKRDEVAAKAVAMVRTLKGLTGAPQQQQQAPRKPTPVRPAAPHGSRAPVATPAPAAAPNPWDALAQLEDD